MTSAVAIDVTAGFSVTCCRRSRSTRAAGRILAYCTSKYSGWAVYDLAGIGARASGLLNEVTAGSLLFASALNGRVEIKQIAEFDRTRRREFADRIGRIPADQDLHRMADDEVAAVTHAYQFGFGGVWGAEDNEAGCAVPAQGCPRIGRVRRDGVRLSA